MTFPTQVLATVEFDGPQILSSDHMDTEKPAAASKGHIILVYTQFTNARCTIIHCAFLILIPMNYSMELKLPIHFRYQSPSPNSSYTPVIIPAPLVFIPHPLGSASLPCHSHTRDTCPWALLVTRNESDTRSLRIEIPCGLQNSLVVALTTLVTLIAAVAVLHTLGHMTYHSYKDQ